jgi:hypothetical protein
LKIASVLKFVMVGNPHLITINFGGKIVSEWQPIGYRLEAKLTEQNTAIVRNQGQLSEQPHLIINIDRGNIVGVRSSDPRAAMGSVDGMFIILSMVKEKLLKLTAEFGN